MQSLSKSRILAYRQCAKRLWLDVHRPEQRAGDGIPAARAAVGVQVGKLARQLYDPQGRGELVDVQQLGYSAAFARTQQLLAQRVPIFEAALQAAGASAFADVLLPVEGTANGWRMIEVKSSARVKAHQRDDVAVQAAIAKAAGLNLQQVALAHVDTRWRYAGDGDYGGLLVEEDLTNECLGRQMEVADWVEQSHAVIASDREPEIEPGSQCYQPYTCEFYSYCTRHQVSPEFPVGWLPAVQTKALRGLLAAGASDMRELPDTLLTPVQRLVKQCTLSGEAWFDKAGAVKALADYPLPAYFLDFESVQLAVPVWAGCRPYQQMPFQFSLHRLDDSGLITHKEFLDLSGNDPCRPFAESLLNACDTAGPIYVYNINFERTRVKELAQRFADLRPRLLALNERMVDLQPLAKRFFYHPSQQGSWSIKKLLPAVAPELRYDQLDGVQDGAMAMNAYAEAIADGTSQTRRSQIRDQLLRYCELDTWAMVKIWAFFSCATVGDGDSAISRDRQPV